MLFSVCVLSVCLSLSLPVTCVFMSRVGIVWTTPLRPVSGYCLLVADVVPALVTPPDAGSMLMLLGVVGALYEIGIVAAQLFVKHTKTAEPADPAQEPVDPVAPGDAPKS